MRPPVEPAPPAPAAPPAAGAPGARTGVGARAARAPAARAGAPAAAAPAARAGAPAAASAPTGALALVEALRPRQWLKNALVVAAPAAAGVLATPAVAGRVALAFVAFCLVASAGYLLNDVADAAADRRHPGKRGRPVASGRLAPRTALLAGAVLLLAGFLVGWLAAPLLCAALAGYVALTVAYTARLRHVPVLDLAAVSAFFVVRAVGGGLAAGVPLSRWFLIVATFGSLFVVAGKRAGEHAQLGAARAATRPALMHYSLAYLRSVRTLAAGVAVTAYCLWAFEPASAQAIPALVELSIVPFVLFVLRYAMLIEEDGGQAPEDLVLTDRGLQLAALAWLAVFLPGVSLG